MNKGRSSEVILCVDDSPDTLEMLQRKLAAAGYTVFTAPNVAAAIALLNETAIDLVITDLKMPGTSGLDLVRHVRENAPDAEVMMMTGYATVEGAVEAVKTGAGEYLAKPFTDGELLAAVSRSLENLEVRRAARLEPAARPPAHGIIGESEAIREVFRAIEKASTTNATVLIAGESGTGKELVARAIHYNSGRAAAPFVPVNCGAIPEELLESELFGYARGAFTGARDTRAGFFQAADGGTIFLDEVSETGLSMQVKLLRVLEDREIFMVGSRKAVSVDARVLAATNKNLRDVVAKGLFREDLFYRLNVITVDVPPLRERGDDVLLLARRFAEKYAGELGKPAPRFADGVLKAFLSHPWPGNVRELENLVQRLVLMVDREVIDVSDLPALMRFSVPAAAGLNRTLAEVEAEHIRKVLESVGGNKSRAAAILGIDRKTLREKLKQVDAGA
jgi:two-component system response regulator HydG